MTWISFYGRNFVLQVQWSDVELWNFQKKWGFGGQKWSLGASWEKWTLSFKIDGHQNCRGPYPPQKFISKQNWSKGPQEVDFWSKRSLFSINCRCYSCPSTNLPNRITKAKFQNVTILLKGFPLPRLHSLTHTHTTILLHIFIIIK